MPTIAVVGAGKGLGLSVARMFGKNGYDAALIARNPSNLDALVASLAADGVKAAGFTADTGNPGELVEALGRAASQLGPIEVLEYSPYDSGPDSRINPLDVTLDNLRPVVDSILYGGVAAAQAVLPAMRAAGRGTLLFTGGVGSINPLPILGTLNTAQAALRSWVVNAGNVLEGSGVYAAHIAIGAFIGTEPVAPGTPYLPPDDIAATYWQLHLDRTEREKVLA